MGGRRYGWSITVVNLVGFLFHVMVARTFEPGLFGSVAALLGLLVVFQVPANALQVRVARAVAEVPGDGPAAGMSTNAGPLLAGAVGWGLASAAVLLAVAPWLRSWMHLPTFTTAAMLGAYAVPIAIGVVPKGLLFGEERYGWLSASLIVGAAVQLALGTVLVHGGHGAEGALGSMVAGELVTSAILVVALASRWGRASQGAPPLCIRWRDASFPAVAFAGFWLLSVVDLVLAQHYMPGASAGAYAAAATAAQVSIFVPAAVSASAFARFVGASGSPTNARLVLLRAATAVLAVEAVAVVVVVVFAKPLVHALYAGGYHRGAQVVGMLAAAGACIGLSSLLLQYHLAAERRWAALSSVAGLIVLLVGVASQHHSPADVARWALIASAAVAMTMLLAALASARRREPGLIEEASLALLDADLDLTIVVPYYNPGHLLAGNIERLMSVLDASESTFEVIAVSDGSTDGSERSIQAIDDPRLVHVVLPSNVGKGAALRVGLAKGRGRWLGFIDADGDLDPYLFEPFQVLTHLYSPEVILGSKRHPLSEVEYPRIRQLYSLGYQWLIHLLFRLQIGDTQTGIKLIRRDVLAAVLPRMVEKRFAFDLELFVIARRLGYRRFLEAPVRIRHQFTSTVSFKSVRRTLLDTIAIFYRLRLLRTYDEPHRAASRQDVLRLDSIVLRGSTGSRRRSAMAPLPKGNAG